MSNVDKFLKLIEIFCIHNARGNWPDFWDAGGPYGVYKRAASIPDSVIPDDAVKAAKDFITFILHENPRLYDPQLYPQPMWLPDECLKWRTGVRAVDNESR
jgi:hypothetical protein